jgi:hypothetical protein
MVESLYFSGASLLRYKSHLAWILSLNALAIFHETSGGGTEDEQPEEARINLNLAVSLQTTQGTQDESTRILCKGTAA